MQTPHDHTSSDPDAGLAFRRGRRSTAVAAAALAAGLGVGIGGGTLVHSLGGRQAGLQHQRLSERVMALDEVLVSGMEAFEQAHRRDLIGLPLRAAVALDAGEN